MNKAELVDAIASKTSMSKKDVTSVVDAMQDAITDVLAKGNKVSLVGFGTFQTSKRKARTGLNPRTRETIHIPACTVPKFVAGKGLKEKVR
ncbi:DNA-binding protein [Candidatus Atribacteria bacterium RBG_16_35_8]|nr:MAG: DNA-binding protein [Candidatus Atribacteria bacterium RBG_16_35_8]